MYIYIRYIIKKKTGRCLRTISIFIFVFYFNNISVYTRQTLLNVGISYYFKIILYVKLKYPLAQATKAQKGEYRYSYSLSLTSALYGGGWSATPPAHFTPGKDPVPNV